MRCLGYQTPHKAFQKELQKQKIPLSCGIMEKQYQFTEVFGLRATGRKLTIPQLYHLHIICQVRAVLV